jgi:integrase
LQSDGKIVVSGSASGALRQTGSKFMNWHTRAVVSTRAPHGKRRRRRDPLSRARRRISDVPAAFNTTPYQLPSRGPRHSFRHAFATHLQRGGVAEDVRMRLTGHETKDHRAPLYAHGH